MHWFVTPAHFSQVHNCHAWIMRFDPQANMVDPASPGHLSRSGAADPNRWVGRGLVLLILLVLGGIGTWMWTEYDLSPASIKAAITESTPGTLLKPEAPTTAPSADPAIPPWLKQQSEPPMPEMHEPVMASDAASEADDPVQQQRQHDGEAAYARGKQLMGMGRYRAAIPHLQQAVDLLPESVDAHYRLGMAYCMSGQYDHAREQQVVLNTLDSNRASLLGSLIR
jgi:tetratricopeptide (TPR) repeat protein